MVRKVALSACLAGKNCRYDGRLKENKELVKKLEDAGYEIVLFCPEESCFGTPREAMDLVLTDEGIKALGRVFHEDKSMPIVEYAERFFEENPDIDLFVGKARSPSCGVRTALLYDEDRNLISDKESGIMAAEARVRGIESVDDEDLI